VITHPADYELAEEFTKGATIITTRMKHCAMQFLYIVKNWSTYNDYGEFMRNDPRWMLTEEKLNLTNNAKVMHCLPVRRNVELSDEILDSCETAL
jgi:N-succinyl-L-ornithine transcarbamylase